MYWFVGFVMVGWLCNSCFLLSNQVIKWLYSASQECHAVKQIADNKQ